jgi:peptidoglycan/xylan/chitin deacetylase (PgdA/CDA1 family)
VREIGERFEIGAHTLTHPDLTRLPPDRVRQEILESKARIEDGIGAPVSSFAYPFGRFDDRSVAVVTEHFCCACSDFLGVATRRSNPFLLPRVDAYYLRSRFAFTAVGAGWFPWVLRLRNVPRRMRRRMGL